MERCDRGCRPERQAAFDRMAASCWLPVLSVVLLATTTGPAYSAFLPSPSFLFRSNHQEINVVPSRGFLFSKPSSPSCLSRSVVLSSGEQADRLASVIETSTNNDVAGIRPQEGGTVPSLSWFNQTFLVHNGRSADMILRSPGTFPFVRRLSFLPPPISLLFFFATSRQ